MINFHQSIQINFLLFVLKVWKEKKSNSSWYSNQLIEKVLRTIKILHPIQSHGRYAPPRLQLFKGQQSQQQATELFQVWNNGNVSALYETPIYVTERDRKSKLYVQISLFILQLGFKPGPFEYGAQHP